jgi:hypothetical protein
MMITIAVVSVLLAIVVHRQRRTRELDGMVINQAITVESAEANIGNAVLARETAECGLLEYTTNHDRPRAEVPLSGASGTRVSADQSRLLAILAAEQAKAEERLTRIIQQLHEGNYADVAIVASTAAVTAIRDFRKTLKNHVAAIQASQVVGAFGPAEKERLALQHKIEEAGVEERIKKIIWDYEKAYLKSLRRERANLWW